LVPDPILVGASAGIVRGTEYSVTVEVTNSGNASANGVSVGVAHCYGDQIVFAASSIGPGETVRASSASLSVPLNSGEVRCPFEAFVDPENLIDEENESDNSFTRFFDVL
jgi:subtilase family serine protease